MTSSNMFDDTETGETKDDEATEAESLKVVAPKTVSGGVPFTVTVTARTSSGAIASSYSGSVTIVSSDPAQHDTLASLSSGSGTATVTLHTAGVHTITAVSDEDPGVVGITSTTVASSSSKAASSSTSAQATAASTTTAKTSTTATTASTTERRTASDATLLGVVEGTTAGSVWLGFSDGTTQVVGGGEGAKLAGDAPALEKGAYVGFAASSSKGALFISLVDGDYAIATTTLA